MSASPAVRRLVMFKHGVAYVERGGPATGPFELAFRRDEMNDVLKSLAVWVARGDARVGALSFDAPEDPEKALEGRRLLFPPGEALLGLVRALRGGRVVASDGERREEGEVIGYQRTSAGAAGQRDALLVRADEGRITTFELAALRTLEIVEASSRADLAFLVERSRAAAAEDSRIVRVALTGEAEDVRVSYVIPAPMWRVSSYRVVADGADTLLMAWGIVHNPTQEELADVDLTLTTGEPVSFVMDLYTPKTVARAVVEEQVRGGAAPTRFEGGYAAAAGRPPPAGAAAGAPGRARRMMAFSAAPPDDAMDDGDNLDNAPTTHVMSRGLAESLEALATGETRAEFFEYRVLGKVSLKRGGSAMVPLVSAKIGARKERIWRAGAGANPSLVLTFSNDTGAVLEEGPAVLYDDGVYSGEAMVPFAARGVDVKLAYAKDLGVRCRHASATSVVVSGIRLDDQLLVEEQRREEKHVVVAENDHADSVELVIEIAKTFGRTLSPEHAHPSEETASYYRFRLTVPPRGRAELVALERWADARHLRYQQIQPGDLERWLEGRFLDEATLAALSAVLAEWARAKGLDAQRARVEQGRDEAHGKQQKIGEQLGVLKEGGPEGALRLRYVKELEREQDKINACEAEIQRLRDEADEARAKAMKDLARLTQGAEG